MAGPIERSSLGLEMLKEYYEDSVGSQNLPMEC